MYIKETLNDKLRFNSLRPSDAYRCIIGSDNGLSPVRRQAIIWTNFGILLIGPLGTNFSESLIRIQTFSFKKLHLKTSSAKWRLFCLGLNEINQWQSKYSSKACKTTKISKQNFNLLDCVSPWLFLQNTLLYILALASVNTLSHLGDKG